MELYHITISTRGRRALARDQTLRRALVRVVARVLGRSLLLFSLVDDHLHVVVRCDRPRRLGARLRLAIAARVRGLELEAPHVRAVEDRRHLLWLVRYLLTQTEKHGLRVPPALWSGSCVLDLLDARLLPGYDARTLREELPRLGKRDLLQHVGLEPTPVVPATDEDLARLGVGRLAELAAAVLAVGPDLARAPSKEARVVAARTLAIHAARLTGATTAALARALGIADRSVRRLGQRPVDRKAMAALRVRVTLEERATRGWIDARTG